MLTEMLKLNPTFQALEYEEQLVLARLASTFIEQHEYLYMSPEELTSLTKIGNRFQWQHFLNLEPTQAYIRTQMAQATLVLQRKTLRNLQSEAQNGNIQAIKEINVLSGIMAQEDTNKTIVLHQIKRPPPPTLTTSTKEVPASADATV